MRRPGGEAGRFAAPDTWEQGTTNTIFDGDFKKAKLSEEAYGKAFATADEKYAHILTLAHRTGVEGRVLGAALEILR